MLRIRRHGVKQICVACYFAAPRWRIANSIVFTWLSNSLTTTSEPSSLAETTSSARAKRGELSRLVASSSRSLTLAEVGAEPTRDR